LAEYQQHLGAFSRVGVRVMALSVDDEKRASEMRRLTKLDFEILCDPTRKTVKEWGLFNARERGGIAIPATFVIDRGRRIRYCWNEGVAARVAPQDVLRLLESEGAPDSVKPRSFFPGLKEWGQAIRNSFRLGAVTPLRNSDS